MISVDGRNHDSRAHSCCLGGSHSPCRKQFTLRVPYVRGEQRTALADLAQTPSGRVTSTGVETPASPSDGVQVIDHFRHVIDGLDCRKEPRDIGFRNPATHVHHPVAHGDLDGVPRRREVLSEDPRLNLLTNPGIVSDRRVEQRTPVHDTDSTGSAPPRSRPRGCILGTVASAATLAASSPSLPPSHATTSDRHCSCGHAAVTATAVMRRVPPRPVRCPRRGLLGCPRARGSRTGVRSRSSRPPC